jgi:hypothetical protein
MKLCTTVRNVAGRCSGITREDQIGTRLLATAGMSLVASRMRLLLEAQ